MIERDHSAIGGMVFFKAKNIYRSCQTDKVLESAIGECVEKGKIANFLMKNRAAVKDMLLTDFDEKKYRKMLIRDSKAEGHAQGFMEGRKQASETLNELNERLFEDGRMEDLNRSWNERSYQGRVLAIMKNHSADGRMVFLITHNNSYVISLIFFNVGVSSLRI